MFLANYAPKYFPFRDEKHSETNFSTSSNVLKSLGAKESIPKSIEAATEIPEVFDIFF